MSTRVTRSAASKSFSTNNGIPEESSKKSDTRAAAKTKSSDSARTKHDSTSNGALTSPQPNTSRKRAPPQVKQEDGLHNLDIKQEDPTLAPRKRAKTTNKATKGSKSESKPKPDFEAGAKLANSLVNGAANNSTTNSPSKPKSNPHNLSPGVSPYPTYAHPTPAACRDVRDRLAAVHGNVSAPKSVPAPNLQRSGCGEVPSVLDALIRTRLSANTNDRNSNRAFQGLVARFGVLAQGSGRGSVDWDKVRRSDVGEVYEAIKSGGLAGVKSKDIKAILDLVHDENVERAAAGGGKVADVPLSLDHVHAMATDDAFEKLLAYPGVGPKTASCVLLFCMQRPSFAVDTHVFRLTRWLGWTPSDAEVRRMAKDAKDGAGAGAGAGTSPSKSRGGPPPVSRNTTYAHLDVRIPDDLKYPLHYLLIRHGKTCPSCMARRDGKVKDAWGGKPCPIKDLKRASRKEIKRELEDAPDEEGIDDDDGDMDEDED